MYSLVDIVFRKQLKSLRKSRPLNGKTYRLDAFHVFNALITTSSHPKEFSKHARTTQNVCCFFCFRLFVSLSLSERAFFFQSTEQLAHKFKHRKV